MGVVSQLTILLEQRELQRDMTSYNPVVENTTNIQNMYFKFIGQTRALTTPKVNGLPARQNHIVPVKI